MNKIDQNIDTMEETLQDAVELMQAYIRTIVKNIFTEIMSIGEKDIKTLANSITQTVAIYAKALNVENDLLKGVDLSSDLEDTKSLRSYLNSIGKELAKTKNVDAINFFKTLMARVKDYIENDIDNPTDFLTEKADELLQKTSKLNYRSRFIEGINTIADYVKKEVENNTEDVSLKTKLTMIVCADMMYKKIDLVDETKTKIQDLIEEDDDFSKYFGYLQKLNSYKDLSKIDNSDNTEIKQNLDLILEQLKQDGRIADNNYKDLMGQLINEGLTLNEYLDSVLSFVQAAVDTYISDEEVTDEEVKKTLIKLMEHAASRGEDELLKFITQHADEINRLEIIVSEISNEKTNPDEILEDIRAEFNEINEKRGKNKRAKKRLLKKVLKFAQGIGLNNKAKINIPTTTLQDLIDDNYVYQWIALGDYLDTTNPDKIDEMTKTDKFEELDASGKEVTIEIGQEFFSVDNSTGEITKEGIIEKIDKDTLKIVDQNFQIFHIRKVFFSKESAKKASQEIKNEGNQITNEKIENDDIDQKVEIAPDGKSVIVDGNVLEVNNEGWIDLTILKKTIDLTSLKAKIVILSIKDADGLKTSQLERIYLQHLMNITKGPDLSQVKAKLIYLDTPNPEGLVLPEGSHILTNDECNVHYIRAIQKLTFPLEHTIKYENETWVKI